ncbi:MAG: TRAM domain-containing protein [Alphaproteobacteria bacterium]
MQDVINEQQAAFNAAGVGTSCEVLFERAGRHPGQLVGRSPHNQAVHVDAPRHTIGDIAVVIIETCKPHSLEGRLLDRDASKSVAAEEKRLSA